MPIPWQFWGWALLAVTAGASFVVQASVNTNLRISLSSASWASFISYLGGTVVMALVLLATRQQWPQPAALAGASWLSWTGGFWGVVYVMVIVLLLPNLGAATLLALIVTGQMLASLVFDHFGLFGVPVRPMDLGRLAGAALLILGVILIRR